MARPSRTAAIDYADAHDLTHGLLERAKCPEGVPFVLVRDTVKKGLRMRVTQAGGKHWQFETRIKGKLFTRALGEWPAVTIDKARAEAHRLRGMTEQGIDPRALERQQATEMAAQQQREQSEEQARTLTAATAWSAYCEARRPYWGDRHYADHLALTKAGGKVIARGTHGRGVTMDGPLYGLLSGPLADLSSAAVDDWAKEQAKHRPTTARLALRCLKAFLNWCTEQPEYAALVPVNAAKSRRAREALGKAGVKQDALLREQLPAWFAAVRNLSNPTIATCLQVLLLTGARLNEIMGMRWEDVNTKWKGITIRDKVEGERVIPLTPYVAQLLAALPKRNEWVFASVRTVKMDAKNGRRRARYHAVRGQAAPQSEVEEASESGIISIPRSPHLCACKVAGIDGLTLHGLRRSFKSLSEWLELPAGVVAQIMGHKPSATAEKHYTVRPLDLLRLHHEKFETWILEQAKIQFSAEVEPGKLHAVR